MLQRRPFLIVLLVVAAIIGLWCVFRVVDDGAERTLSPPQNESSPASVPTVRRAPQDSLPVVATNDERTLPAMRSERAGSSAGAKLIGVLTFADGTPANFEVAVCRAGGEHPRVALGVRRTAAGTFIAEIERPGDLVLVVAPSTESVRPFAAIVRPVTIAENETRDLGTIIVDETPSLTGSVRVQKEPSEGATLRCLRVLEGNEATFPSMSVGNTVFRWNGDVPEVADALATTDRAGQFLIPGLPAVRFHVVAEPPNDRVSPDLVARSAQDVIPPANLDFTFDGCPLTLFVKDAESQREIRGYSFDIRDASAGRKIAGEIEGVDGHSANQILAPRSTFDVVVSDADHLDVIDRFVTGDVGTPITHTIVMKPRPRGAVVKLELSGEDLDAVARVELSIVRIAGDRETPWSPSHQLATSTARDPTRAWKRVGNTAIFDRLGLPAGTYRFTLTTDGAVTAPWTLDIPAAGEVSHACVLEKAGRIVILIPAAVAEHALAWTRTTAEGDTKLLEMKRVGKIDGSNGQTWARFMTADPLRSGIHRLSLAVDGVEKKSAPISIENGKTATVTWDLRE